MYTSPCGADGFVCAPESRDSVAVATDITIATAASVAGRAKALRKRRGASVNIHPALCTCSGFANRLYCLIHVRDAADEQLVCSLPVWHVLRHQRIEPLGVVAFQEVREFVDNDHFEAFWWE